MDDDNLDIGRVGTQGKQQALASNAPPTWGEGDAVPVSVDLNGGVRLG